MNKSLALMLMLFTSLLVCAQPNSRWKSLIFDGDYVWDSQSARKVDEDTVRFWYQAPIVEEQRNYLLRHGVYTRAELNLLTHNRVGVIAKCKAGEYGIFNALELKENGAFIKPSVSIPLSDVKMNVIAPDTFIEAIVNDVCRYLKIR